jgi:hypothetical protein
MNSSRALPYFLALSIAALVGCTTEPNNAGTSILARTTVHGKGVPFGRSDSPDPFVPLRETSTDPSYGYGADNPVKVGGLRNGPRHEKDFLNALRGPNGEAIEYERLGSCCPFSTPNGFQGSGLLDAFRITYENQPREITIYVNMYDDAPRLVPIGFTARAAHDAGA